jgi:hypothetical protein
MRRFSKGGFGRLFLCATGGDAGEGSDSGKRPRRLFRCDFRLCEKHVIRSDYAKLIIAKIALSD